MATRRHPLSVAEIREAVSVQSDVIEGTQARARLAGIVRKYVETSVYASPRVLNRLKREVFQAFVDELVPFAVAAGRKSAAPILGTKGLPAAKLRGPALAGLRKATRGDMLVLRAMIDAAGTELAAEMDVAFATAQRAGATRRSVVRLAQEASKAELASLKQAETSLKTATEALSRARSTKGRKAAQKAVTKARRSLAGRKTFLARFETRIQAAARDTIRREVYSAQEAQFVQAGYGKGKFTWIAVGSGSCPDCVGLHGQTRTLAGWAGQKPGDGATVCETSCRCELIPEPLTQGNPGLTLPIKMD